MRYRLASKGVHRILTRGGKNSPRGALKIFRFSSPENIIAPSPLKFTLYMRLAHHPKKSILARFYYTYYIRRQELDVRMF